MFEIQETIIEDPIFWIQFACDTSICRGACCTLVGGTGAPLLDEELEQIENSFPIIKSSLPADHLETIEQFGLYEGQPGSYTTTCFNNRACVFVIYEHGTARCAFEKAFNDGKLEWKKPLSCHLFPIRLDHGFVKRLRYQRIAECDPALAHGMHEQVYLSNFLMEPLIRALGSSWYDDFQRTCDWIRKKPGTA